MVSHGELPSWASLLFQGLTGNQGTKADLNFLSGKRKPKAKKSCDSFDCSPF